MKTPSEQDLDARSERLALAYDPRHLVTHAASAAELMRDHLERSLNCGGPVWPAISPDELLSRWPPTGELSTSEV